jgi:hypothetical protein
MRVKGYPTMRRTLRVVASFIVLFGASCIDFDIGDKLLQVCEQQVSSIEIGPGSRPMFAWSPSCMVGQISVEALGASAGAPSRTIWSIFDVNNSVTPGIELGQRTTATEALQDGQTYRVTIGVIIGGDAIAVVGTRTFTR